MLVGGGIKIPAKFFRIMTEIQSIISTGYFDNGIFKINTQLDRDLYIKYNDVLERFGGKWNKKANGHIFAGDASEYIKMYLDTGQLPDKNPLAFFSTPKEVIDIVLSEIELHIGSNVLEYLEPHGGTGAFIDVLRSAGCTKITSCEIDPYRFKILQNKYGNQVTLFNTDFLLQPFEKKFDVIVMNPPFSVDGDKTAYITHINKAYSLLNSTGVLVAIVPTGWLFSSFKKQIDFKDWVGQHGRYFRLDKGAFKQSGTLIDCAVIVIENLSGSEYNNLFNNKFSGYLNYFIYQLELRKDCSEKAEKRKYEIYQELKKGKDMKKEIENLYLDVVKEARENGEFMPMKLEWMEFLIQDFIETFNSEEY